MARVYLNDEIQAAVKSAIRLIEGALRDLSQTETTVENMIENGETPADIEAYGTTRYKLAGLEIIQAITEIENMNIDGTDGLTFPSVVDFRSAQNAAGTAKANISYFTIANMDDAGGSAVDPSFNTTDGNRLTFVAKPKWQGQTIPNPFASATVGDTFKIITSDADTTKDSIAITGFEDYEVTITDKDVMTDDSDGYISIDDEKPGDLTWRAGYYWMRTSLNQNKIDEDVVSITGAISGTEIGQMDLVSESLHMRQVGKA
jgi:hypothetical protein